jgi:nucleotide-binding universal stress UspA family protein
MESAAMHSFQPRVVVGFDGSESSKDALVFARILTAMTGAMLEAVCVYLYSPVRGRLASGESARAAVARSEQWMSTLQPLQQTIVPALSVADGLRQVAGAAGAELVVVGSHRLGRPPAVRRTPTRDLLRANPPFAVVTVPAGFSLRPNPGLRRIAAVNDRFAADGLAFSLAQRLSELTCSELESLSRSDARRLHRAVHRRAGRNGQKGHPSFQPVLNSPPDLLVVADLKHSRIGHIRLSAFRILARGCSVPVLFVSRGLDPRSFMATDDRIEAAYSEE